MIDADFVREIINIAKPETYTIGERQYSTDKLHLIDKPRPPVFTTKTLDGIVSYLNAYKPGPKFVINIVDYNVIYVYMEEIDDVDIRLIVVIKCAIEQKPLNAYGLNRDGALLLLYTRFQENDDLKKIISIVSQLSISESVTYDERTNGKSVVLQKSIAHKEPHLVMPTYSLVPFSTFPEILQPPRFFHFNIKEGKDKKPEFDLVESDSVEWKTSAIDYIKTYLQEHITYKNVVYV